MLKTLLMPVVNYLLPHRCIACSNLTDNSEGICHLCFQKLNFISAPYCNKCGSPFEFKVEGKMVCGGCVAKPAYYDIARSLWQFDEHSKRLIHAFKYNDRTAYARAFAKIILSRYKEEVTEVDLIVPVPMHRIKRVLRQYNPPQILAFELSRMLNVPMVPDMLIKVRWTKPQTKLTKVQREKNLAGSIIINKNKKPVGAKILLIDDVKTTGTTSNTCARILKQAGATQVKLITIGAT
ncbi:MAG: ComF family protein [Rickettsiaceae bacterium]